MFFPLQVYIGLTYRCNLCCKHCYTKQKRNQPDRITTERAKTLLKELSVLGIFKIIFTHGENLLREDFFEILNFCSQVGLHSTLISNGILLNNESVINKIKKNNLSKLFISFDSLDKDYEDYFKGRKDAWQSAIKAIELCSRNKVNFGIISTINKSNFESLEKLVNFAISKKAKEIDFLIIRSSEASFILKINYSKIIEYILQLKKKFESQIVIGFHDPLSIKLFKHLIPKTELGQIVEENKCKAGKYFASITPEGNVYPCNFLPIKLGNILNNNFKNIWENTFQQRKKISAIPKSCQGCEVISLCRGGCRAFTFYNSINDFPKQDQRCNMFKL